MKLTVTTFGKGHDGTRSRQINGFDDAKILIRGERSGEIAEAIIERFTQKGAPRRPIGAGGCIRIDERGIWLLNRAESGWSSSAIRYESWRELFGDWDFQLGTPKTDASGVYWPIEMRAS